MPDTELPLTHSIAEASASLRNGTPLPTSLQPTSQADPGSADDLGDPADDERAAEAAAEAVLDARGNLHSPQNGKFMPKADGSNAEASVDGELADEAPPAEGDELPNEGDAEDGEPKTFVLKGEPQRGEEDIELDITGLPDDVVKRLEHLESRGMRRKEFDQAMQRLSGAEAQLAEIETRLKLNPEQVVLDHMPTESQLNVGARILLEHWDRFAPLIEQWWTDDAGRNTALRDVRDASRSLSDRVASEIASNRQVAQIRRAIDMTIPDGVDPLDADAYRAAAQTVLARQLDAGAQVTPDTVPALLATLATRYGFQAQAETPTPPKAKPKLVVRNTARSPGSPSSAPRSPSVRTGAGTDPTSFANRVRTNTGVRAVAGQGVGAAVVRRPAPPDNATIEQASAWIKSHPAH